MNTNEHEERNKKSFWGNNWQWIVSMVMFVVFAGFMIYNTWPQKHPETRELLNGLKQQMPTIIGENTVEQETTIKSVPVYDAWGRVVTANKTSSTTKKSKLPESYVISKENMDKALTAVAYAARTEAQNEYKNNFSILLTILTIFGIAWPVIITVMQSIQFKHEREKLDAISKDYAEQKHQLNCLQNELKKQLTCTYREIADNSHAIGIFWGKQITDADRKNKTKGFFMYKKGMARAYMKTIYYYAMAGKIDKADSKVNMLLGILKKIQQDIDDGKTKMAKTIDEIDWDFLIKNKVKKADDLRIAFLKIFSQPWPNANNNKEI